MLNWLKNLFKRKGRKRHVFVNSKFHPDRIGQKKKEGWQIEEWIDEQTALMSR